MKTICLIAGLSILLASPGVSAQAVVERALEPEMTFHEPFTRIRGLVELPGDRILVADQGEKAVYLGTFGGGPRIQVGRQGEGPGEYKQPIGLFQGPGDSVLVYDLSNGRYGVVTPQGMVGTIPLARVVPAGSFPNAIDRSLRTYWDEVTHTRILKGERPGSPESGSAPLLRFDGTRMDTLGTLAVPGPVNPGPIPEWDRWEVNAEGWVAIVRNQDRYQVEWVSPAGERVEGPVIQEARVRVGSADRRRLEDAPTSGASFGGAGARPARASSYVPDRYPFALRVAIAPGPEAWVERAMPGEDALPTYDVFDRSGRRVARYRLPQGRRLIGFGDGTLYASREDEVGLSWVERYRYPVHR